ncbi:MAG: LuxR family transcriptional regulator, partial [Chitinophagaceae bacterium]
NCRAFGLSARETEVALRLCQGWTYKAIAEELNISSRTVDKHAQNIFLKTGVNKKIDLQQILGFTVNLQYSHDDITSDF